jgi:predicted amino acid racemase
MLVIDLGKNEQNYKTGDLIEFNLDYMGILRIMNSRYVEKRLR